MHPTERGIATKGYVRWFDKKWGKEKREQKWIKLLIMVGVRTQIITAAEVTPGSMHDSPFLPGMVESTTKNFTMREVSADMGYLSRKNLRAVVKLGAEPLIPFMSRSRSNPADPPWSRLFAYYTFNREEFMGKYHKRSLSETTFSAIKRVLGAKSYNGQVAP